ncbi:MAG TPA: dienelactone hydrolase family protein [Aliidongia sp.]|nr:dienelactone hydrolase family protein [Aliidongia sp.]
MTIKIDTADGPMNAYIATPKSGSGPALVVIQEIFGVNKVMRDLADSFAAQGYIAVCPDLFWRIEPGIDITDKTEAEWKRAFELFQAFNVDKGVDDIARTIAAARKLPGASGKVGTVGYCLGGKLAFLTVTRTDADAAVGYYGVGLDGMVGEASKIHKPLMLHIAGKDEYGPPPVQKAVHAALDGNPLVTLHDYPNDDHAFARVGGQHYDKASADLANGRTAAFFKQHLA